MPTPRAASFSAGSRPARPVTVFRRTGKTLYNVKPMNAGKKPMLLNPSDDSAGTITASSARLGIVWITLATASTGRSRRRLRVIAMPAGMLTAAPASSANSMTAAAENRAIVNNSSVDGQRAFPQDPIYSAAKHGVLGLTKSAGVQYASRGIRINAVCPGWIRTPPIEEVLQEHPEVEGQWLMHQPIGRLGTADEQSPRSRF